MRMLIAEARKEFLVIRTNKAFLIDLIVMPLVVIIFLGYAEQGLIVSNSRYQLPIADLDHSVGSARLIAALRDDGHFDLSVQQPGRFTAADAAREIGGGKHIAVLVIPHGAGRLIAAGQRLDVPVYFDPAQQTRAGLMLLAVQRTLDRFSAPAAAVQIVADAAGMPPATVSSAVRLAVTDQLASPQFTVATHPATRGRSLPNGFDEAVPGIALMWSLMFFSRGALAADDERRTFHTSERAAASPASRVARVLGRLAASYVTVGIQVATLFVLGALVFRMDMGNVTAMVLTLAAFVAVPAAASVAFGAFGVDAQLLELVVSAGAFVLGALSGAFVPLYLLPHWLVRLAIFSPLYWAISAVQDVMLRGAGVGDVVKPVLALLALAAVLAVAGTLKFQRTQA